MTLLKIDEEKCKRDGLCVSECPFMLITQLDPESVPSVNPGADKLCINCGHCVAVCPHGALSHKNMSADQCPEIKKQLIVNIEQVEQLLKSRRSIRAFKDKIVPQKDLDRLIQMADYAPTAHNDQEVEWLVVSGAENVKKVAGMAVDAMRESLKNKPDSSLNKSLQLIIGAWDMGIDVVCRNAPHLIFTHAEHGKSPFSAYYPIDCAMALAYLELAAPSFGIGTCWNGLVLSNIDKWKPLRDFLEIPEKNQCHGALMAGYANVKYYRIPLRRNPAINWKK